MTRPAAFSLQTLILAIALTTLSGCMTTAKDVLGLGDEVEEAASAAPVDGSSKSADRRKAYRDPMVASAAAADGDTTDDIAADGNGVPVNGSDPALAAGPQSVASVSAADNSLFSATAPVTETSTQTAAVMPETPASLVPSGVPQHRYNAAAASLFSAPAPAEPPLYPAETSAATE